MKNQEINNPKKPRKLLDQVRDVMRLKHHATMIYNHVMINDYSMRTWGRTAVTYCKIRKDTYKHLYFGLIDQFSCKNRLISVGYLPR